MKKKATIPFYLTVPRISCVVLSIVMVALQWLPFWKIGKNVYSISDLLWFIYKPEVAGTMDNPGMKDYLTGLETTVNDAVLVPLFILIACIATFLACFMAQSKMYVIAPICATLITLVGFPIRAELRGGNLWFLYLIPAVLMAAAVVLEILNVKLFGKKETK